MSTHVAAVACRFRTLLVPFLLLSIPIDPAAAQVLVSVQGGVHAARLDRPERAVRVPGAGIALEGAKGEATTLGIRVGGWLSNRWGIDGGIAVSSNHGWNGGAPFGLMVESLRPVPYSPARLFEPGSLPRSRDWGSVLALDPLSSFMAEAAHHS